jgi:hypothetical protein
MSYTLSNEEILTLVNGGLLVSTNTDGSFLVGRQGQSLRPLGEDKEIWQDILVMRGEDIEEDEKEELPETIVFTNYLHERSSRRELEEFFEDQTGYELTDALSEKLYGAFYELAVTVSMNTRTGEIELSL